MVERRIVPAAGGAGLRLKRGEQLRVIGPEGGQTGDLVAYSPDGNERLSNGHTFNYGGKVYVSTGDVLWSNHSNPMLTILSDQAGRHDRAARRDGPGDRAVVLSGFDLQWRRANPAARL